jgi:hypothetical protein
LCAFGLALGFGFGPAKFHYILLGLQETKSTQAEAYATEDTPNVPKIGFPIGCCE